MGLRNQSKDMQSLCKSFTDNIVNKALTEIC